MTRLTLQNETIRLTRQIKNRVDCLKRADPVKSWFAIELEGFGVREYDPVVSLDEANARLRALKQLDLLVFQHSFRLQYPGVDGPLEESQASLLTVEARLPSNVLQSARDLRFSIEPSLLHEPTADNEQFDPVSPTAKVVGFLRGMDETLQLVDERMLKADGEKLLTELGIDDAESRASMAVLFQSRYHALNAAIAAKATPQIVEFASGISPRIAVVANESRNDLRRVRSAAVNDLQSKTDSEFIVGQHARARGVLHCCAVDVLNRESVFESLGSLDTSEPFTIVTEGLLLYFGECEMHQFFGNMSAVLQNFSNAVWITDLVTKQNLQELLASHPGVAAGVRKVFSLTGRSVVPSNPFETDCCLARWLDEYEMEVESTIPLHSATPIIELDVPLPQVQRNRIVGTRNIWTINSKK